MNLSRIGRFGRISGLVALALWLGAAPAPAPAQGLDIMRSTTRTLDRALSGQVGRALMPRLSVRGAYETPPRAVALAPGGTHLAVVTGDGGLRVLDLAAGVETVRAEPSGGGYAAVALGPRGALAVLDARGRLGLAAPGAAPDGQAIALDGGRAQAIAAVPGGFAIGHADGRISLTGPEGRGAGRLGPVGPGVLALAAPDPDRLAVAGSDGRVRIVARGNGAVLADWRVPGLAAVAAGDGRVLTGGDDGAVLWSEYGERLSVLDDGDAGRVTALAAGAPGAGLRALVAGPGNAVALIEPGARAPLATLYPTRRGWGAVDGRGRFDGDETAFDDLAWSAERRRLAVERFSADYFEPGLLYKHLLGNVAFLADAARVVTEGIPLPPEAEIKILAPADRPGTPVRLRVSARASKPLEIAGIRLFHNGKRVAPERMTGRETGSTRQHATLTADFAVPAVAGQNAFRAVVRDSIGIDSDAAEAALSIGRAPAPGRLHLTAIGIDRYANSALNLNYAVADANGIAETLPARGRGVFGGVERDLLLDGAATRAGIEGALARLGATAPEDAAVIFLAGHAQTVNDSWYFLSRDLTDPGDGRHIARVGLSGEALAAALTAVPARRILLVVDACYAGAILGPFERFAQRRALHGLKQQTGVVVIAATRADQQAPEFPILGHGLMTYVLLEGLKPGRGGRLQADQSPADGRLTARELQAFVEETVPGFAALLRARTGRGDATPEEVPVTPVGLAWGVNFSLAE